MSKTAITPTRAEDYPEWFQQVIMAADLAEHSPVRGCMVIKPWGYAIWENIQKDLDQRFKDTGHENAYFPLLIPLKFLEKEAAHVEGFAKECAVVTHHRLVEDGEGGLKPSAKLEEPYVIRPTSEAMIGSVFANWVQSHRDLPILINQWANVMRWEMRTRLFLRTSEFLWQEGHTAHSSKEEAIEETLQMVHIYADFAQNILAMPVIVGEKTQSERFPGAVNTYCIEAMMQDGKALQSGTSHFLGQTFSKAYDIQYTSQSESLEYAWTTSWGVSTRLIGGLIMTHSDDDGLILPPRIAPKQIVILPIYKSDEDRNKVLSFCDELQKTLSEKRFFNQKIEIKIDDRDIRGGEKKWYWIKKGVPIRIEIGPRDLEKSSVMMSRRDLAANEKQSITVNELQEKIGSILEDIQKNLFERALDYRDKNSCDVNSLDEFNQKFSESDSNSITTGPFVTCYSVDDPVIEKHLKPLKVTPRCIPLEQDESEGTCIFTGEKVNKKTVFAKSY